MSLVVPEQALMHCTLILELVSCLKLVSQLVSIVQLQHPFQLEQRPGKQRLYC